MISDVSGKVRNQAKGPHRRDAVSILNRCGFLQTVAPVDTKRTLFKAFVKLFRNNYCLLNKWKLQQCQDIADYL